MWGRECEGKGCEGGSVVPPLGGSVVRARVWGRECEGKGCEGGSVVTAWGGSVVRGEGVGKGV